jgi:hypothetical protein
MGASTALDAGMQMFGGKDKTEKDRESYLWWLNRDILGRKGNPYEANVGRQAGLAMEGASGEMQGVANQASKRLGLDSGSAWKDIAGTRGSLAAQILAKLFGQANEMDFNQKQNAMSILGGLS